MFGKRCTLCGGKLDSRKICTECGLNNNQSERYYKINQSSCDNRPLTHVHKDEEQWNVPEQDKADKRWQQEKKRKPELQWQKEDKKKRKKDTKRKATVSEYGSPKKGKKAKKLVAAFVIISVLGTVVESISEIGINNVFNSIGTSDNYEERDPYEAAESEGYVLPELEGGDYGEFELSSGKYIVGVHIPAGNYSAEVQNDFDAVQVEDVANSIYLYEYAGKEGKNYLDDLRLFDGAVVMIYAESPITLTTDNAQTVQYEENPLTKSYEFSSGAEKIAGTDFEPGVYDFSVVQGSGTVEIIIYDEENEEIRSWDVYMGESSSDGMEYRNVILPQNANVMIEDDGMEDEFKISVMPSPQIASTDYLQAYMDYNY